MKELRVHIDLVVPLPEKPFEMSTALDCVKRYLDDMSQVLGRAVQAKMTTEEEIVSPRRRQEQETTQASLPVVAEAVMRQLNDAIHLASRPVVYVPPMDPAPVIDSPATAATAVARAYAGEPVTGDDLHIPTFLKR